ncbi:unnamed protein product [Closterium sp. NIES-64]|nr:unnamed protein product [Closterium sp. NIES-64]
MLWEEGRRKEFKGGASSTSACLNLSPSTPPPSFLSTRRALPLFLIAGGVAHNIAECMAALSAAPFLISAVGDDAAGSLPLSNPPPLSRPSRPMAHPFSPSSPH